MKRATVTRNKVELASVTQLKMMGFPLCPYVYVNSHVHRHPGALPTEGALPIILH